ncbi:THAP domain-containing protein 11 isoform X2 [Ixodes scapularis]
MSFSLVSFRRTPDHRSRRPGAPSPNAAAVAAEEDASETAACAPGADSGYQDILFDALSSRVCLPSACEAVPAYRTQHRNHRSQPTGQACQSSRLEGPHLAQRPLQVQVTFCSSMTGGTTCCVPGCHNNTSRSRHVSWHRFPKNNQLRNVWVKRIDRKGTTGKHSLWMPTPNSRICGAHFSETGRKKYMDKAPRFFGTRTLPKCM